jgi:hypothetical protein
MTTIIGLTALTVSALLPVGAARLALGLLLTIVDPRRGR